MKCASCGANLPRLLDSQATCDFCGTTNEFSLPIRKNECIKATAKRKTLNLFLRIASAIVGVLLLFQLFSLLTYQPVNTIVRPPRTNRPSIAHSQLFRESIAMMSTIEAQRRRQQEVVDLLAIELSDIYHRLELRGLWITPSVHSERYSGRVLISLNLEELTIDEEPVRSASEIVVFITSEFYNMLSYMREALDRPFFRIELTVRVRGDIDPLFQHTFGEE